MRYLYAQLLDLVKPCTKIKTQMTNQVDQKVRSGRTYMWNGKDGLAKEK